MAPPSAPSWPRSILPCIVPSRHDSHQCLPAAGQLGSEESRPVFRNAWVRRDWGVHSRQPSPPKRGTAPESHNCGFRRSPPALHSASAHWPVNACRLAAFAPGSGFQTDRLSLPALGNPGLSALPWWSRGCMKSGYPRTTGRSPESKWGPGPGGNQFRQQSWLLTKSATCGQSVAFTGENLLPVAASANPADRSESSTTRGEFHQGTRLTAGWAMGSLKEPQLGILSLATAVHSARTFTGQVTHASSRRSRVDSQLWQIAYPEPVRRFPFEASATNQLHLHPHHPLPFRILSSSLVGHRAS